MKYIKQSLLCILLLINSLLCYGQVSIVSGFINVNNVVPKALCEVNVMNSGQKTYEVNYTASLKNTQNQIILQVKALNVSIRPGLNSLSKAINHFDLIEYGTNLQAELVKTRYMLPTGKFKFCCEIVSIGGDEVNDEYCDEIESDFNLILNLIYPYDKDTIFTNNPILIWHHNLPFEQAINSAFNYRIIVSKMETGQNPEQTILTNTPVFKKDFLASHQVQYPFGATKLEQGNHYAWQVQQMENSILTNKTEAWEFIVAKEPIYPPNKYAVMKSNQDAGFYTVSGDLLLFKFDEEYKSIGNLISSIYDSKRKIILPVINDDKAVMAPNLKKVGDNRYEINLAQYNLKKGFYTLEVSNEKHEKFYLQFNITF